jgi:hypothetical protein
VTLNVMLPRLTILLANFLLVFLAAAPVMGAPIAKIVSDENGFGCSELDSWKEHRLKIVVSDANKLLAEKAICSSYGEAEVVVEKDAKGIYFLLLKYGEGRGTNARSEFLSIYKLGHNLIEHVRIPISEPASSSGKWRYDYRVSKPKSGGLLVSLILRIDSERDVEFAPEDKQRTIEIR